MEREAMQRASALRAQAVSAFNNGRPGRALRLIEQAFTFLGDGSGADREGRQVEIELWISRALPEAEVFGAARGLDCLAEAGRLASGVADNGLLARIHSQTAAVAMRGAQWDAALTELAAAEALIDHADDNDKFAILLNAGSLRLFRGELAGTRTTLNRALRHARRVGRPDWILKAAHNLGYAEFLAGNLPTALSLMAEALGVDADVSPGVPLLDRARVLVECGLFREADEALARAAAIFAAERSPQDLAEAELERARCALALGDPQQARRMADRARRRFGQRGNTEWRRSAESVTLQAGLAAGVAPGRLIRPAERLTTELTELGLRLPARTAGLVTSELNLALGRVDQAVHVAGAIGPARRDDPITGRVHWHYVSARLAAARGAPAAASRRVRSALDELARYQATFGSIDLRTAAAVHGRRLAELDIGLALDSGRGPAVFAAVERARAVSSRLPAVRPPADEVAADLLADLRQNLESLRAVEQDRAASAPLLRKRRELERAIAARSWTVSGSGSVDRPASLPAVRAALAERERAMVTYVQAADRMSALVVDGRTRLLDLGPSAPVVEQTRRVRADLDVLANPGLPTAIRSSVRASLETSLRALDRTLLGPLGLDGPLVLVSTGVLGQLPWASLPSLRGRSIVVAPSATKWLSSTASGYSTASVAALAGPDLGRGSDEVEAFRVAWPGADIRGGQGATASALAEAMLSADVLHVAAHGVHQPENPLFSSVRMADGPVFAHELDRNGRAPSHVVLSACEVGLATIRPGDEALGLASVLLHLGTRSVIAGVARVGDDVAAETMAAYHRKLAAGADSSAALAEALFEADTDVTPPFVNFGAAWAANLETASPVA